MNLTLQDLAGTWREPESGHVLTLSPDGTARSVWQEHDRVGTWGLTGPDQFVARFVIPLNMPDVDDELNAAALIYTVKQLGPDQMVLEEFDNEEDQVWTRTSTVNDVS